MDAVSQPTATHARRAAAFIAGALLPGAGHWVLGERTRGTIIAIAIAATFWIGIAIGGVRSTLDYKENRAWFVAQAFCGGHTAVGLMVRQTVPNRLPYITGWPSADTGIVFCGVAGLLNVLTLLHIVAYPALGELPKPQPTTTDETKTTESDQPTPTTE